HAVPAAVLAASAATALVALNRLGTPTAVRRQRVAGEAAILLLIAGLAGLLVAILLPPPDRNGGSGDLLDGRDGSGPYEPQPQFLIPIDQLDAGGTGTGRGDELMFRVTAAHSALWRTMTFDSYDGRTWARSGDTVAPTGNPGVGAATVPPGIGDATSSGGTGLRQHIEIETAFAAALPAALRPDTIRSPFVTPLSDGTVQGLVLRGQSYDLTSRVPPSGAGALRPRDVRTATVPFDVRALYLPFPGLPSRVTTLAGEITAGAATQYDQVVAVVDWMRANTVVRPGTRALPTDADPVDQYLFVDRAGSSQQAATATAMLLRVLGIPARLAVGYLPGDHDPFSGDFVVRARHAHAWVEVWFPEVGWVGLDPAGRFLGPEPARDSLLDRLKRLWWVLVVAVMLVLAYVAWRLLARRRRLRARPWATQTYERLTRAGSRHGRPRWPSETPAEYCDVLADNVADRRLVEVGQLLTTAAWSTREPAADIRAWADEVVAATERCAPAPRGRSRRRRRPDSRPGATGHNMPAG
ncbi:MAG: transglutaminase-like domain-containing protein, partial [Acidimicrobiales bacterium]